MSELKEVKFYEMNAIKLGLRNDKLYFKSEADKVIAHHKYKRCFAMAERCEWERRFWTNSVLAGKGQMQFAHCAEKWRKRWLALAEEPTWAKFLQLIHKEAQ